jgi:hypothetical protein
MLILEFFVQLSQRVVQCEIQRHRSVLRVIDQKSGLSDVLTFTRNEPDILQTQCSSAWRGVSRKVGLGFTTASLHHISPVQSSHAISYICMMTTCISSDSIVH